MWNNYLTICEKVDLETMPGETLDYHIQHNSPVRPYRISAWLARQGHFIASWALWEYYSRSLCLSLTNKEKKAGNESTVDWVARSLAANNIDFGDQDWFCSANHLRNLIAHFGTRAAGAKAEKLLERSRGAFPDIDVWKDGYIAITHDHLAELQFKIDDFIRYTGQLE